MKMAVDKVGRGKARVVSARFRAMTGHFLFEADFCNAAAGWEKGPIEKNLQDAHPRLWHDAPKCADLDTLHAWLEQRCVALWSERMPIGSSWSPKARLSPSMPPGVLRGFDHPARTIYDWRHYLAVIQRKPGALRNGAPFCALPDAFRQLQAVLLKHPGGDRQLVEILSLVLHHDEQAVLCAIGLALRSGAVSKEHVLNLLNRLLAADAPPPVEIPARLTLRQEPAANVHRYDHLREAGHAR